MVAPSARIEVPYALVATVESVERVRFAERRKWRPSPVEDVTSLSPSRSISNRKYSPTISQICSLRLYPRV